MKGMERCVCWVALWSALVFPGLSRADGLDAGWVSNLRLSPENGLRFELGNMRDGRIVPVLLGSFGASKVVVDGEHYPVRIEQTGVLSNGFSYRCRDFFEGEVRWKKKSEWEFSVERRFTALQDIKISWFDNYLNSILIAGRDVFDPEGTPLGTISKTPLPVNQIFNVLGDPKPRKAWVFDSVIGKMEFDFSSPIQLVDHRAAPWRRTENAHLLHKVFSLEKGEGLVLEMHVRITPDFEALKDFEPLAGDGELYSVVNPVVPRHVVVPSPKKVAWVEGGTPFLLERRAVFLCGAKSPKVRDLAVSFFDKNLWASLDARASGSLGENEFILSNGRGTTRFFGQLAAMRTAAKELGEGGYLLRVVDDAVLVAGKDEAGMWNGLMTLFQLARHQVVAGGIAFDPVEISDEPDFPKRGIYVRIASDLDYAWSRQFVEAMAEMKYNQVYLHFGSGIGVRFKSSPYCYDRERGSVSVGEFREFVDYIKRFNMEIVPIWAAGKTMLPEKHIKACSSELPRTISKGKNWDISTPEAFDYNRDILDELIEITGATTIHLGLDEIYHFARYCQNDTGDGAKILSDYINHFTDYYAPKGIRTIVYHDMFVKRSDVPNGDQGYFAANAHEGSEGALDRLRNRDMLRVEDWSYSENKVYAEFDYLKSKGLDVFGSCWFRYKNLVGLSAYTQGRSDTFVCTYWSVPRTLPVRLWDPRGDRGLDGRFKMYKFLPAMVLAGEMAWNAGNRERPYDLVAETLRLFNQRLGLPPAQNQCVAFDILPAVNRTLSDAVKGDGRGFVDLGRNWDLRDFPAGKLIYGGIPFLVPSDPKGEPCAVTAKGRYAPKAPSKVSIPFQPGRYERLVFLHTCHFEFGLKQNKRMDTAYVVCYQDGTRQVVELANDGNIMAWAPALTRFDSSNTNLWFAWNGLTVENVPIAVYGYDWINPCPEKKIVSVEMRSQANPDDSVFLLGLTGIKARGGNSN